MYPRLWYVIFAHLQVLNFAVKLALRQPADTRVQSLASFVLEMARFDLSHDLRDRARFMTAMLGLATADEGVDEAALLALNAKAGQVRFEADAFLYMAVMAALHVGNLM